MRLKGWWNLWRDEPDWGRGAKVTRREVGLEKLSLSAYGGNLCEETGQTKGRGLRMAELLRELKGGVANEPVGLRYLRPVLCRKK